MAKKYDNPKQPNRAGSPRQQAPDRFHGDPIGTKADVIRGLTKVLPAFCDGGVKAASASQVATVLSITGQMPNVSTADVGNVFQSLGGSGRFHGEKLYFDLVPLLDSVRKSAPERPNP